MSISREEEEQQLLRLYLAVARIGERVAYRGTESDPYEQPSGFMGITGKSLHHDSPRHADIAHYLDQLCKLVEHFKWMVTGL